MEIHNLNEDRFSSHTTILKMVNELGNNLTILDVGCSSGFLAEILSKRNIIYGTDIDDESGKKATKFCKKIVIGDIEQIDLPFEDNFFDLIICGDVIEHLKDPWNSLIKIRRYLKKGGNMILSTGNVANWYVRFNLLIGRFDYQERGILAKTHCKLFTFNSLKKMVENAGLYIVKTYVTPIPLPLVFPIMARKRPFHWVHLINYVITLAWKKLFAYQFALLLKSKSK